MAGCKYCGRDLAKTHLPTCPLTPTSDADWLRELAKAVPPKHAMAKRLEGIADALDAHDYNRDERGED